MSKMQMNNYLCLLIACTFLLVSACKQKDAAGDQPVVISKHTIPVNTDNIDKTVTDSLGGAGFENLAEGLGWETNTNFNTYNNVSAPKGGSFHMSFPEYPSTLRTVGRDSRNRLNNLMQNLVYQPLLGLDSETMEYIPNLATHWKISEDKMTYWFRLDPNAKWSDGQPVVAKDVIATWDLMRDEGIESPSENETYGKFERPEEVSKYIIKVPNKEENWRNFLYFSVSMAIFPNHYLEKIDGKNFLTKYDEQMMPSTGPYTYDGSASKEGELIVLKRRDDFWAKDYSVNKGLFNFDQLKFSFVADDRLALEKVKKGEFDFHTIQRAQWWKEELTADKDDNLKRNLLQKVKVFNFKPAGTQSLMLNTLEPPFDDINVRKAMGHLWNIEESVEKLMYNEYERCVSYYQGSVYQNKSNEVALYNPDKAVALLAKAGYTKKAGEKWLSKDGKRLEIDLRIAS
ncbi:MAG: ABC transporter substrate-binding protein, partial [Chitinophagales bacterium]